MCKTTWVGPFCRQLSKLYLCKIFAKTNRLHPKYQNCFSFNPEESKPVNSRSEKQELAYKPVKTWSDMYLDSPMTFLTNILNETCLMKNKTKVSVQICITIWMINKQIYYYYKLYLPSVDGQVTQSLQRLAISAAGPLSWNFIFYYIWCFGCICPGMLKKRFNFNAHWQTKDIIIGAQTG
jgi:hypothetical protein